ncbi:MAG TPA: hypothetical protein VLM37_08500, partial [Fibrobacteraceae bacterium]|nr:hypothetical protein [Fibrobacteraceae bacterium]
MMISRFLSFFAIPIAVLLSCAPHPANQDGSSNTSADSSAAPNGEEEGTPSAQQIPPNGSNVSLSLKRPGFRFEPPDPNWALVSDPSNDLAPLEFYNTVTGLRATLSTETLVEDQSAQIADRAQAELQSRSSGNQKNIYAELHPMKLGVALSGVGWEEAGLQDGKNRQSTGMAALLGNQVFVLSLSASDSLHSQTDFLKRFQAFFAGLKIDSALIQEQGPAVGERVQQYQSTALDYQWSSSDTIWHRWTSLDALNTDPDLTLTDTNVEISLFTYGAYIDPQEVSSRDLFRVFLVRLGLNAEAQDLQVHKKGSGEAYTQDFETVHSEGEKRIHYRGRFFYEKGRALLIAVWTQDSLYKTYRPIMERALKGLKPSPLPSTGLPDQQRLRQINARIINQVGLLRLAEDQPLVALSYFEKANRMDPSEPLYLINCGFVYQLRNLYGPGTDHYQSQMALVQKSGKLLSILGEMYEALHDYNRALEYYEMALRFTPNDPELVINQSDALWGIGQRNQSLEVVQNLYRKQPSARLGVYVAKTLMGLDQYAEAVDLLYSLQKKFSLTRDMGLALIEALTFLQRHQEALAISDQLLPLAPENFEVWNARGKTQFHLKQFRAAEVSLQHALKIKSDDEDAKSFLSATKAFLGKADIRALQAPIEPVLARPKNLKFLVAPGLVDSAKSGDFPAVVHWQEEVLKAGRNTPWVRTEAQLLQILDPRGAGLFQEFTFTFLPGVDRIFINALEVYDSNWKLKNRWTVKEAYITYLSDKGSGDEAQMAHLPLTDLRPGDYVFLEVSRTSIENTGTLPYVNHVCSREIPVGRDEFKLLADTLGILSEEYGPIERQAINGGLLWSIDWPVVVRKEVYMPIYRDFGAGVLVASKQSWQQVGKDYQTLIQHQFKSSIPVREKAFEVLG